MSLWSHFAWCNSFILPLSGHGFIYLDQAIGGRGGKIQQDKNTNSIIAQINSHKKIKNQSTPYILYIYRRKVISYTFERIRHNKTNCTQNRAKQQFFNTKRLNEKTSALFHLFSPRAYQYLRAEILVSPGGNTKIFARR